MDGSSHNPNNDSSEGNATYVSYRRRWYILATLSILNVSSVLLWFGFAPVAYTAAAFYERDVTAVNMLSIVFMIIGIPCGMVATWLLDKFGLRLAIIVCSWLTFIGAAIKIISAVPGIDTNARLELVFLGSVLAALAQPFIFFTRTKLSALWFPENDGAKANMTGSMCSLLAIMLAGILSPILAKDKDHILFMLCIESIPAFIAVVMATAGVCCSKPLTLPSARAETSLEPFLVGVKALVKNKMYFLLIWTVGGGIGLFTVMATMLSQIICPLGYDINFSGFVCMVSMTAAGLVGAVIATLASAIQGYLDRLDIPGATVGSAVQCSVVGNADAGIKAFCFFATSALVSFLIFLNYRFMQAPIAISLGIFGFCGLLVYQIGNKLSVETAYRGGAATISGILFMFGHVQGVILMVVLSATAKELRSDDPGQVCKSGKDGVKVYDMFIPIIVLVVYAAFLNVGLTLAFRRRYLELHRRQSRHPTHGNGVAPAAINHGNTGL